MAELATPNCFESPVEAHLVRTTWPERGVHAASPADEVRDPRIPQSCRWFGRRSGIAAVLAWLWDRHLGHGTLPLKLGAVFVPGAVAGLVYWVAAILGRVPAAGEVLALLRRLSGRKSA